MNPVGTLVGFEGYRGKAQSSQFIAHRKKEQERKICSPFTVIGYPAGPGTVKDVQSGESRYLIPDP